MDVEFFCIVKFSWFPNVQTINMQLYTYNIYYLYVKLYSYMYNNNLYDTDRPGRVLKREKSNLLYEILYTILL